MNNTHTVGGDAFTITSAGLTFVVTDRHDGTYLVKYTPPTAGSIQISVVVNGQDIKGSTFSVNVIGIYSCWGCSVIYILVSGR